MRASEPDRGREAFPEIWPSMGYFQERNTDGCKNENQRKTHQKIPRHDVGFGGFFEMFLDFQKAVAP